MTSFLKNKKIVFLILFSILYFLFSLPVYAQNMNNLTENLITNTPLLKTDLLDLVFKIIRYVLAFLGVVAVVILIYGGFVWMTARGNDERVNKAKKIIVNGLVGLIVILLSYAIVSFAIQKLQEISGPPSQFTCTANECFASCQRCNNQGDGTFYDDTCTPCGPGPGGNFVWSWSYPRNNQEEISLCTLIQSGFNANLDPSSVNANNVKINLREAIGNNGDNCNLNTDCKSGKCTANLCVGDTVAGTFTVVQNVFKFDNSVDFEPQTWYRVLITTNIKNDQGKALAFPKTIEFQTGSTGDTNRPVVDAVSPPDEATEVCLLDPIQARFSEAMDVTTLLNQDALSTTPSHQFNHWADPTLLTANPRSSYQPSTLYDPVVLHDDVITDVCGNFLDCTNGKCNWNFTTGANLRCDPEITAINPTAGFYNDEVTISGNYFRLGGEVIFNQNIYLDQSANLCFDINHFPQDVCLNNWQANEVKIKVPATGGVSQGAISGPIYVKVGEVWSNSKYFTVGSPYIQSFNPKQGVVSQALTIKGLNFGSYQEGITEVYFVEENNPTIRHNGVLACRDSGWRDKEIVVQVPPINNGNYFLQIKDKNGKFSNVRFGSDELFTIISGNNPGPTLCDISPYCTGRNSPRGGKSGDLRTFSGFNFGETAGRIIFNDAGYQANSWSPTSADINIPNLSSRSYQAKVEDADNLESNFLTFISPCIETNDFAGPCFLDSSTCTIDACNAPYDCKSSSDPFECRCCCNSLIPNSCPTGLECDETQTCYKSQQMITPITGVCCGCTSENQCSNNEICKSKSSGPNCCYACELGDDSQGCKGGECCSQDCGNLTNQQACEAQGCNWGLNVCTGPGYSPYCCQGRCVNHQCLTLCGNNRLDPSEQCDGSDLGGKTCQDLGFIGGTLSCAGNCTFDTTQCQGVRGHGAWGETCVDQAQACPSGERDDCQLAVGATCIQNISGMPPFPPCACCCDKDAGPDTCKIINSKLSCDENQTCSNSGQKGLCCGCTTDADCYDAQHQNPPYIGLACVLKGANCCLPMVRPTDLTVRSARTDQIKLNWKYLDSNNLGEYFEIYKKDYNENNFLLLTACEVSDKNGNGVAYECDNSNTHLDFVGSLYEFEDNRGGFLKDKDYSYKIRTKKGTNTYSQYTDSIVANFGGTISCQANLDCPSESPCCRTDNNICVDWDNCQGHCTQGDRCVAPTAKFATYPFRITTGSLGPCLLRIEPNRGTHATNISLYGRRFGINGPPNNQVTFTKNDGETRINADYLNSPLIWQDQKIQYANAPLNTLANNWSNQVKVVVNGKESNPISFYFIPEQGKPGDPCYEAATCPTQNASCLNPTVYSCKVENCSLLNGNKTECLKHTNCVWSDADNTCNNYTEDCSVLNEIECQGNSHCSWNNNEKICKTSICRCCCDPGQTPDPCKTPQNQRLFCKANVSTCTGNNRGICCGCQSDNDCGDLAKVGCGMIEQNPKCCYNRPKWIEINFCNNNNYPYPTTSPAITDIPLNTGITLVFDDTLDFNSLTTQNIRVSRDGVCDTNEGETIIIPGSVIIKKCYISGSINKQNENGKTSVVFNPSSSNCQLKTNTIYKVEVIADQNGNGIRSEKGVSLNNATGACLWDASKKCLSQDFTTSSNSSDVCKISLIVGYPTLQITNKLERDFNCEAFAKDEDGGNICVNGFDWSSSDSKIATVRVNPEDAKKGIATSKSLGEIKIIASITTSKQTYTCNTSSDETCCHLKITGSGPQVIERQGCSDCDVGGPSPSPLGDNSCLEASMVAKFDRAMNEDTYNDNNILLRECAGSQINDPQCGTSVPVYGIITFSTEKFSNDTLKFQPADSSEQPRTPKNLVPNKVYRLTLKSGNNGIKDLQGQQLDGNKNGVEDGEGIDDYVWYFKTKNNNDPCSLNKVCVYPGQTKIIYPATQDYYAEVYSSNCNYLEPKNYSWSWQSILEDHQPAWQSPVATVKANAYCSLLKNQTDCQNNSHCKWVGGVCEDNDTSLATASSVNLGITNIMATAASKSAQSRLIVATPPIVDDFYPPNNSTNRCRNIAIYAQFDQIMDENSIKNNYQIKRGEDDVTQSFVPTIRRSDNGRKTIVYFIPKEFLIENSLYSITLYGKLAGISKIKSINPFSEGMAVNKTWSFTTGNNICQLESVKIDPPNYLFNKPLYTAEGFTAHAYYHDLEIEPIPDHYDWDWEWRSSDTSVVKVNRNDNNHNQADAQSQTKDKSVANIIARATIKTDNIFIPSTVNYFKEGVSRIQTFFCEDPWPCTSYPDCQPYKDTSTNFLFMYCRDAGLTGPGGNLPILKGGKINGPSEPGLEKLGEHFFTVYKGSLSFLYDGAKIISQDQPPPQTPENYVVNVSGYNSNNYTTFGNNNALMVGNIITVPQSGNRSKFGKALYFDGDSSLVVKSNQTIKPENFSLETWIKPKGNIDITANIFKTSNYNLELDPDLKVHFSVLDKEGNKAEVIVGPITTDWTHLAATYNSKNLKLYINSVLNPEGQGSTQKGGTLVAADNLIIGQFFEGEFDDLALWQEALSLEEITKHNLDPISPTMGDVIGFKVFANRKHLWPVDWYHQYINPHGSGSNAITDGYQSYQVGRSLYVGATNIANPRDYCEFILNENECLQNLQCQWGGSTCNSIDPCSNLNQLNCNNNSQCQWDGNLGVCKRLLQQIYSNIYLISQSDNPQSDTSQIFRQSISNWNFNTNVNDSKIETSENENKAKIVRDLQRFHNLENSWQILQSYKNKIGHYPILDQVGGTYVRGMSNSKWPSWTPKTGLGQDLVKAGLSPLPNDFRNEFSSRTCGTVPFEYQCCADCPRNDPQCTQTCYNPQTQKYEGINHCYILQYMSEATGGASYGLYNTFEYSNPDDWYRLCGGLAKNICLAEPFCEWVGTISEGEGGQTNYCTQKSLNYSYSNNPCGPNNNCACFNTKLSSSFTPSSNRPIINIFKANPSQIISGQTTTLTWDVDNAASCTALADPENTNWSGSVNPSNGSKVITLTESTNFYLTCQGSGGEVGGIVRVLVTNDLVNLNISLNGQGRVSINPPGSECQDNCIETYNKGVSVTLKATPNPGYTFDGWSGACSGTNNSCVLIMQDNESVIANFKAVDFILTVNKGGTGDGTVTFNPPNQNYSLPHQQSYAYGTPVILTAVPATGSSFVRWEDICSNSGGGMGNTCSVLMDSSKTARAVFDLNPTSYNLNLTISGTGFGNIWDNSSPQKINCIKNSSNQIFCSASYSPGTEVTLSKLPWLDSLFVDWTGDCSGSGDCVLTMNDSKNVTANITLAPFYQTAYIANNGVGNNKIAIINNSLPVPINPIDLGTNQEPRAICITPNKQYIFVTTDKNEYEKIYKIQTSTNSIVSPSDGMPTGYHPDSCAITPDGQFLIVGLGISSQEVRKYLTSDLSLVSTWYLSNTPLDLVITPDNLYAYLTLSGAAPNELARITLSDGSSNGITYYDLSPTVNSPRGLAVSRDGKFLFINNGSQDQVTIFSLATNSILNSVSSSYCDYPDLATDVSSNNQYLYIGCSGFNSQNIIRYEIINQNPYLINSAWCGSNLNFVYDLDAFSVSGNEVYALDTSAHKFYYFSYFSPPTCSQQNTTSNLDDPKGIVIY